MLVEFDPSSYTATEGEGVMFRIVKRTDSSQEVTVVFTTRPLTASGMVSYRRSKCSLLSMIMAKFNIPCLELYYGVYIQCSCLLFVV